MKNPLLIVEDSAFFKQGQLVENYKLLEDGGVEVNNNFLKEAQYIVLTEKLSKEDEKVVRDLIRKTLKTVLWNLYTKSAIIIQ